MHMGADNMKGGIVALGLSIFFAGACFQEAITGTWLNQPDGGYVSAILAVGFFLISHTAIMNSKGGKRR